MAKPDKTDLLNADVAQSMNGWAKATVALQRDRNRERVRMLRVKMRTLKRSIARAG